MNIALEETQEVVEGVQRGKYGDTFIRGNNGEYSKHFTEEHDKYEYLE